MDLRNFPMDKQKCRLNLEACKSILRLFNRRMASMCDKREGFALAGAALEVKVVTVHIYQVPQFLDCQIDQGEFDIHHKNS